MFKKEENGFSGTSEQIRTLISEGCKFEGNLFSPSSTRIDGIITGDLTGEKSIIIGDKGYVSVPLRRELYQEYGITLLAKKRSNQKDQYSHYLKRTINRLRKRVETTNNQLEDQLNLSRVRARIHWGLLTRIADKFAAFTLGAFINLCLGRKLTALKDLVFA